MSNSNGKKNSGENKIEITIPRERPLTEEERKAEWRVERR